MKERNVFWPRVAKFCESFSRKRKLRCSILSNGLLATPITITSMPMFTTYRVKLERIILFVKIANRYFERKECFLAAPIPKFDGGSRRIKGAKTGRVFCSHYSSKCLRLASEKFVLASE